MFERQFGLRENPFAAGHQSRFVYPSREHQEALAHLRYGIENREPFVLITGEVGTGKTTALYDVLSEWQSRVAVALITNSALTRDELLEEICVRFGVGVPQGSTKPQLLIQLERHLLAVRARGERAILLLDEAQNLHRDLLEEIRLLSNLEAQGDKLAQVFLVGQPELETILARPELRQLRQRIAVHYRLHPLSEDDTERYIHHRITVAGGHALTVFPSESAREVFRLTHGIPREINTVASQSMLNAFVEDSGIVMPEHVRSVEKETEFQSVMRGSPSASAPAAPAPPAAPQAPRASVAPPASAPPKPPPVAQPKPAPPIERMTDATSAMAPSAAELEASLPPAPPRPASTPPKPAPAPEPRSTDPGSVKPAVRREDWEAWRASLGVPEETDPAAPALASSATTPAPSREVEPPKRPDLDMLPLVKLPDASSVPPAENLHDFDFERQLPTWNQAAEVEPIGAPVSDFIRPMATPPEPVRPPRPKPEPVLTPREARPEPVWEEEPAPVRSTLSPSLRRKLEFDEDQLTSDSGGALRWLGIAAVAAVVIVGAILGSRMFAKKPAPVPAHAPAVEATPSEPVVSTPVETPPSPPAATPAPVATNPPAPAPQKPAPPAAQPASAPPGAAVVPMATIATTPRTTTTAAPPKTEAPKPASEKVYGISVATFLNRDRAEQESVKLAAATSLPSRVTPVTENGDQVFSVVLGEFPDRTSAETVASRLIEAGTVDEARVTSRKKEPEKR